MIKLLDLLKEISFNTLFSKTPQPYKSRASNISVKLKTIGKNIYFYQTTTKDATENRVHNQVIRPLPKKQAGDAIAKIYPIKNINDDVAVWCDCKDFTFENEYILWKNNASRIVNSNGQPPTIKNPLRLTKLCKHLVAVLPDFKRRIGQSTPAPTPPKPSAPITSDNPKASK